MSPEDRELPQADADRQCIADYLSGASSHAERESLERRIRSEDGLADLLYQDLSLTEGLETARAELRRREETARATEPAAAPAMAPARTRPPIEDSDPWWARLRLPILAPALAMGVLALLLVQGPFRNEPADRSAGVFRSGATQVQGVSPSGELDAQPDTFRWTRDPGASHYRLAVYDLEGHLLFRTTTTDTVGTTEFTSGTAPWPEESFWQVTSLGPAGEERSASEPLRYRVNR